MENKKRTYFKLGRNASVFSDHTSGLKITKNVPGSTEKAETKPTREARANGHIIEIDKSEFDEMMSKLTTGEKKMAYEEQGLELEGIAAAKKKKKKDSDKPADEEEEEEEEEDDNAERDALIERLAKIKMPPAKRQDIQALPTEELKAFIEAEEKK